MKSLIVCAALLVGCTSMPINKEVDQKLNDLNRRVLFLYEIRRSRLITPEYCKSFSGPEMRCNKKEEDGSCNCMITDNTGSMPKVAESEEAEQVEDQPAAPPN